MSTKGNGIRDAILGADRPFKVIDGGRGGPPGGPPGGGTGEARGENPCPITPLGDAEGVYHFLDPLGQKRQLTARQLGNRHEVRGLFRGDEVWLREKFPDRKDFEDESGGKISRVVGFQLNAAAAWLQKSCSDQGLYGDFLQLRRPGIWRGEDGLPIVHAGDGVLINQIWHPAGTRTGNQIWIATPATPRPAMPCDHSIGEALCQEIQRLWKFKLAGAPQLLVGQIATGMLGTAARWRPNGFLSGEGGSGKTMLMDALRAACPMHAYSNNASEAGVTSLMNGRVVPIFIDESSDRQNQGGAEALMDLVLASASGEGTKAVRGRADGGFRTIEMAGCILYGSVNPPTMLPQHLGRITLFELLKPDGGEDALAEQTALREWAIENGPAMWGRAIAAAERWHVSLTSFRSALATVGCAPREMDQLGALLAGWWIMTREGLPGEAGAREGVGMAADFIRPATETADDSGPRRAVQHLLSQLVQFDGTTRQEQVGILLERSWEPASEIGTDEGWDHGNAARVLARFGMRPIPPCLQAFEWRVPLPGETDFPATVPSWHRRDGAAIDLIEGCKCKTCLDRQRRPAPRLSSDGGVWLMPMALKPLSQHLNIEIGVGQKTDQWPGVEFWARRVDPALTLEALLVRCEVIIAGIDGGGLDDLFGLAVLGRDRVTKDWLLWSHGWCHRGVLERRQSIAQKLLDFEAAGEMTIVDDELEDISAIVEIISTIKDRGLLGGVAVDPAGLGEFVDAMDGIDVTQENGLLIGVGQGYRMMNAIKTAERRLANGTLWHGGSSLMAWCVENLRIEPTATAIRATKQNAGDAKIDPAMAMFDAIDIMTTNPEAVSSIYDDPATYREVFGAPAPPSTSIGRDGDEPWDPAILADVHHPLFDTHRARFERWQDLQGDE